MELSRSATHRARLRSAAPASRRELAPPRRARRRESSRRSRLHTHTHTAHIRFTRFDGPHRAGRRSDPRRAGGGRALRRPGYRSRSAAEVGSKRRTAGRGRAAPRRCACGGRTALLTGTNGMDQWVVASWVEARGYLIGYRCRWRTLTAARHPSSHRRKTCNVKRGNNSNRLVPSLHEVKRQ